MSNRIDRRTMVQGSIGAALLTGLVGRAASAETATPGTSPSPEGDVRVVAAANGDIEITGTPERVVLMEYELVENGVILGLEPVGVCERDSINQWVPLPEPLSESIVDLGARDEPDLETMIELQPDLIIAAKPRQDEVLDRLEAIAPTVQLETYSPFFAPTDGTTPIENFQHVLMQVAQATNREAAAEAAIQDFDSLLESAVAAVAETDNAGKPFVFAGQFPDMASVTLFNDHSRIAYVVSQLGLVNQAGENEETPGLHYQELSIEQLGTALSADTLFFVSQSVATADEMNEFFAGEVWQAMPFVKAGNFINLGLPNVWSAGSAITLSNLIGRVVDALGGQLDA
ncbi:MAG TPA: iron-siderophore ABC transporter substrate-binding protein [Thermomicrobiales bacterium]|nr:iron-siderophore ABC transporter substrate-binding protein [Thermomicrobiales bacterium]